jgi:hypothetical protein
MHELVYGDYYESETGITVVGGLMTSLVAMNLPSAEMEPTFEMGKVVATSTALDVVPLDRMANCLELHSQGVWGRLPEDQYEQNIFNVEVGGQLRSVYLIDPNRDDERGNLFWIITEGDRSITTVLLPDDY